MPSVDDLRGRLTLIVTAVGVFVLDMVRVVKVTLLEGRWMAVVVLALRARLCPTPSEAIQIQTR
jgi:hypothetical protein